MNRRILKANSITTYDTATLWRALEASSANHQNQTAQKETARRWQRAASRLLRQNTLNSISQTDHLSRSSSGINGSTGLAGGTGVGGNGLPDLVLNCLLSSVASFFLSFFLIKKRI